MFGSWDDWKDFGKSKEAKLGAVGLVYNTVDGLINRYAENKERERQNVKQFNQQAKIQNIETNSLLDQYSASSVGRGVSDRITPSIIKSSSTTALSNLTSSFGFSDLPSKKKKKKGILTF